METTDGLDLAVSTAVDNLIIIRGRGFHSKAEAQQRGTALQADLRTKDVSHEGKKTKKKHQQVTLVLFIILISLHIKQLQHRSIICEQLQCLFQAVTVGDDLFDLRPDPVTLRRCTSNKITTKKEKKLGNKESKTLISEAGSQKGFGCFGRAASLFFRSRWA